MKRFDTLNELLEARRDNPRGIRFIDGEDQESVVSCGELYRRALDMLGQLQARGIEPGDELILFTKSNERFLVAFWGAVLGGIVCLSSYPSL